MSPNKVCPSCGGAVPVACKQCSECGTYFDRLPRPERFPMTFTLHEWRLLAIAASKVKESAYIHAHDAKAVRELARRIAKETGK